MGFEPISVRLHGVADYTRTQNDKNDRQMDGRFPSTYVLLFYCSKHTKKQTTDISIISPLVSSHMKQCLIHCYLTHAVHKSKTYFLFRRQWKTRMTAFATSKTWNWLRQNVQLVEAENHKLTARVKQEQGKAGIKVQQCGQRSGAAQDD